MAIILEGITALPVTILPMINGKVQPSLWKEVERVSYAFCCMYHTLSAKHSASTSVTIINSLCSDMLKHMYRIYLGKCRSDYYHLCKMIMATIRG